MLGEAPRECFPGPRCGSRRAWWSEISCYAAVRSNRPHYKPRSSVRPFVRPFVCLSVCSSRTGS